LYAIDWQRRDLTSQEAAEASARGGWLLLMDRGGTGAELSELLRARGETCVCVVPGERFARVALGLYEMAPGDLDPAAFSALLAQEFGGELPCRGVVHLWSLDAMAAGGTTPETLQRDQLLGSLSALYLAQALIQRGQRDMPRLWLVTRGAQAAGASLAPVAVSQAPLWGFGRVLAAEHPELSCTRVDLDPARAPGEVSLLLRELDTAHEEDQIALRASGRYAARLVRSAYDGGRSAGAGVRADGTYLIAGGLGGLGLSVARWLVAQGARHLVLVGRSGAREAARSAILAMEATGAQVVVAQADISDRAQMAELFATIEQRLPPLRGVVHAAVVASDSTVLAQSAERFWTTMAPKMHGAWNLHELTGDKPLDFFVLYSSVMSLLGAPGSGNYASADAFLDALAHHRRWMGLPALSIDWGIFSDVGSVSRLPGVAERIADRGMGSLTEAQGLKALERLLQGAAAQVGVLRFNLRQWLDFYPNTAQSRFWEELRKESDRSEPEAPEVLRTRETIARAKPEERQSLLEGFIREQVARVLRLPPNAVERSTPLTSFGMDSLMGLELRNRLEAGLGLVLPATLIWAYPHVAALTSHLGGKLGLGEPARRSAPATPKRPTASVSESVTELSRDELMAELSRELGA
jgi:NAD(P)-dependent dehydrogenase (short-subunit alcohol dehydrogenase family)/acyl carrier protein